MLNAYQLPAVAIATYNEAQTIGVILDALGRHPVVVVDDNSPDGTGAIAHRYANAQLVTRYHKHGIASAYITALRQAIATGSEFVVQMDAGLTHKPEDVQKLVATQSATDADLVIGSRFCRMSGIASYRTLISLGAAFLMRRIGVNVCDATSGFRLWRADLLDKVLAIGTPRAHGFAFQLELLYRASTLGARIAECPIPYMLTNSSFNPAMVVEALRVYGGLVHDHVF